MHYYCNAIRLFTVVLFAGLLLMSCKEKEETLEVTLAMLTNHAASYHNKHVLTAGLVRRFDTPLHYWIEDENLNRVEIFPHEAIAPYLGMSVLVHGHFTFSVTQGRQLSLSKVELK